VRSIEGNQNFNALIARQDTAKLAVSSRSKAMDVPEDKPWERPGSFRLDCEPHRGVLLVRLAWAGLSCALGTILATLIMCVIPFPHGLFGGFVSLPLTIGVVLTAKYDLRQMNRGERDPSGRELTEQAHALAGLGTLLVFMLYLFECLLYAGLISGQFIPPRP
jgi:hypothetical protein